MDVPDLPSPARCRRLPWCNVGFLVMFALLGPIVLIRYGLQPRDPLAGVAVVFAPWTTAGAAVSRATAPGASLVRLGSVPSIVVVLPREAAYVDQILGQGALFALDPQFLATCAPGLLTR